MVDLVKTVPCFVDQLRKNIVLSFQPYLGSLLFMLLLFQLWHSVMGTCMAPHYCVMFKLLSFVQSNMVYKNSRYIEKRQSPTAILLLIAPWII